ncbi:MAG: cation diffusion facilitator family transporter [Candidatus Thermoplasmatota archaeon]|nr:cation diffusion facilitator family transporter [Candidatus Thermoplasmatota archaeon]
MASDSKVAVVAALIGNFIIAMLKLITGLAANSAAMLAEAAHSFSDTGNQVLLMVGLARAKGGPTPAYPFGQGKSGYFWPFLVAVLLFGVAGAYSLFEGFEKILHPHEIGDIRLSLVVLGIAFVIEAVVLTVAVRKAIQRSRSQGIDTVRQFLEENRDATLLTVIVEDTLALVGLPVAAGALVLSKVTGNPVWDGIGSLLIGILLMGFAVFLAWEVRHLLVGRGLAERDLDKVHKVLEADHDVDEIILVQSMYLGADDVLLGVELDIRDDLNGAEAEQAIERIEAALKQALPVLRYVYIEPRDAPQA